jgi:hypothetical protein
MGSEVKVTYDGTVSGAVLMTPGAVTHQVRTCVFVNLFVCMSACLCACARVCRPCCCLGLGYSLCGNPLSLDGLQQPQSFPFDTPCLPSATPCIF